MRWHFSTLCDTECVVVSNRAYAAFQQKLVDTGDATDVRNRRDLHGLLDGHLPPASVLHDAKRLTCAQLYARVGSISHERLQALLTFALTDATNSRHVAVHGDPAVDGSKMVVLTCTILGELCRDKGALDKLSPIERWRAVFPGECERVDLANARGASLVPLHSLVTNGRVANVACGCYNVLNACKSDEKMIAHQLSRTCMYSAGSYKRL